MGTTTRIQSIDILRGLVMIIMAIDHTRDFFHITAMTADPLDPATTTTGLFFTRWITHFCAPVFVFLSGVSVFLAGQHKTPSQAGIFSIKRGIWLILAEIFILNFGLSFNPLYNFILLLVIWAIGWSMVLLGIFSRISRSLVLITGITLVFGHDLLNLLSLPKTGIEALLLKVFLTSSGTVIPINSNHLVLFSYAILPWTGIMFLGYSAGLWYRKDFPAAARRKYLLLSGLSLCALFVVLRISNAYGDPSLRKIYPTLIQNVFSFLNASKYPPSLQFFCMTIGPALLLLSALENISNKITKVISGYGSVPFFFYVVHFYVLHLLLVIVFFLSGHQINEIIQTPFFFRPPNFGFTLPVVYTIWLIVVASLYRPCLWFKRYKTNHDQWWLKYI